MADWLQGTKMLRTALGEQPEGEGRNEEGDKVGPLPSDVSAPCSPTPRPHWAFFSILRYTPPLPGPEPEAFVFLVGIEWRVGRFLAMGCGARPCKGGGPAGWEGWDPRKPTHLSTLLESLSQAP